MHRRDKHNYYLDIAETVSERGTCLRRNYGAIIVKHDSIIATGYSGAPRGRKNCIDLGTCMRENMNIPRGERYEMCRSVHAEANAIINASRDEMLGSILYLCGKDAKTGELIPDSCACGMCKRLIINAGIDRVIIRNTRDQFQEIVIRDWVFNDDTLSGSYGY